MNINDGGPAFPCEEQIRYKGEVCDTKTFPGMTLRDWFAGKALAGMLSNPDKGYDFDGAARDALKFADAMLKAREEKQ